MTAYCSHRIGSGFGVFEGAVPLPGMSNMVAWIVCIDPLAHREPGYLVERPGRRRWFVKTLANEVVAEATCPAHAFTIAVRYLESNGGK
jgi:hypothetical protein